MTSVAAEERESAIVKAQVGRAPRHPWRVASRCEWGYPNAIVSPSLLDDGTRFPDFAWLTCPWLVGEIGREESSGGAAEWAARAAAEPRLGEALRATDCAVRAARAAESATGDACPGVGLAGQRDPLGVKCLHAHVALVLAGIDDPVGDELLGRLGRNCADERCRELPGVIKADEERT